MNNIVRMRFAAAIEGTAALPVGAAIMSSHFRHSAPYPEPLEGAYKVPQASAPYSTFRLQAMSQAEKDEVFAKAIAIIYTSFAAQQEPLGEEFEAAIFDDLEGLYEA